MHFSNNLLNGDKSEMGRKLEEDSGSSASKIEMTVTMSGKILVVKHLFIILRSKGDSIEAFSFMRCTDTLSV